MIQLQLYGFACCILFETLPIFPSGSLSPPVAHAERARTLQASALHVLHRIERPSPPEERVEIDRETIAKLIRQSGKIRGQIRLVRVKRESNRLASASCASSVGNTTDFYQVDLERKSGAWSIQQVKFTRRVRL